MKRAILDLFVQRKLAIELSYDAEAEGVEAPSWIRVRDFGGGRVGQIAIVPDPGLTIDLDDERFVAELWRGDETHRLALPLSAIFQVSGVRQAPPLVVWPVPWASAPSRD